MSRHKIALINILILLGFLIAIEGAIFVRRYFTSCFNKEKCNFESDVMLIIDSHFSKLGLTVQDEILGYKPRPLFSKRINNQTGWPDVSVNIDKYGFRQSFKPFNPEDSKKRYVLTVGDSFTFGSQVSDEETWQSCLNKKQDQYIFVNAGVFAYGTAQSVLRAEELLRSYDFDGVIISTLVGHNFTRDKYLYKWGFPRPTITLKNNELIIKKPSFNRPGSKYSNYEPSLLDKIIASSFFIRKINPSYRKKVSNIIDIIDKESIETDELIKWATKKSKSLSPNVYWLLQYTNELSQADKDERFFIKGALELEELSIIDTYENLHGDSRSFVDNKEIWNGHHTALGNEIVCELILKSKLFG